MKILDDIYYLYNEVRKHGDNRIWWSDRINYYLNGPIQRKFFQDEGVDIMSADWDNLILVDAARYDLFEETVTLDRFDEYKRVKSRGSATSEWSSINFSEEYGNTIYISGNPVPSRHITGKFYRFIEVWKDGFDDSIGTIRADIVADEAEQVYNDYPNKRLIVHFMQPHYPFVRDEKFNFNYWNQTEEISFGDDDRARDVWEAIGLGLADKNDVWEAYKENLEYVMEYVWDLIENLDGKTVIHSDHGNLLGKRSWPIPLKTYGHPEGLRISDLITVPWAIINGDRRKIIDDNAKETGNETSDMKEKLEALGYID